MSVVGFQVSGFKDRRSEARKLKGKGEGRWTTDEGRGAMYVEDQKSEIKTDFRTQTSIFSRPSSERSGLPSSIGFFTLPITLDDEP